MIAFGLLPVWFPWVLKPVMHHYGLDFAHYDRLGWSRFALDGVAGSWENTSLDAKRIECVLPATWLWEKTVGRTNEPPFLSLRNVKLVFAPETARAANKTNPAKGSLHRTLNETTQMAGLLQRIFPTAELTNCTIQAASNLVVLPYATWHRGELRASVRMAAERGTIQLTGRLDGPASLQFSGKADEYGISASGKFSRNSEGWQGDGGLGWFTNRAMITAQFATNGWWPVRAQVDCPGMEVPASLVQRYGFEDLHAAFLATVRSNQFNLQATGLAHPTGEYAANGFPVADFSLAATGSPQGVMLDKLHIQSPWLNANLSNSVGMTWSGQLLAKPAQLQVALDFSKLPGANLSGSAGGWLQVTPQGRQSPLARFEFSAKQLNLDRMEAENIELQGKFVAPRLEIEKLTAGMADGSKLAVGGTFNFKSEAITNGVWKFSGGFLKKFLPGLDYETLTGSGRMEGAFTNLVHHGELALAGFHARQFKPLDLHVKWSGHNLRLDELEGGFVAGASTLNLRATADFSAWKQRKILATVTNLSLSRQNEELYGLPHPFSIGFTAGGTNASSHNWSLAVDGFDWQGPNRQVSLTGALSWPGQGSVKASATNVAFADFSDFFTNEIPNVSLAALEVAAQWSNGPVRSAVSVAGSLTNRAGNSFTLRGDLTTGDTLCVRQLSIGNYFAPSLSVTGCVPVKLVPGRAKGWFDADQSQPIALNGDWSDDAARPFSLPLAQHGELKILKPECHLHLAGSLAEPLATVQADAARMTWQPADTNAPASQLADFHLNLAAGKNRITLGTLAAKLDGQPLQASGEWPLAPGAWQTWWMTGRVPDWSQANGRFQGKDLPMAALARYGPQLLTPEGQLQATLELKAGRQVEGQLSVTNAATRPLGRLTPLRDMAAQIHFAGQRAVLQDFHGQIGGQPVRADGFVDLGDREGLQYQVHLTGTNVPLARSLEFLLRGNFALQLQGASNLPPVLSGTVTLRDGLYLQHASDFFKSGPRGNGLHQPYFSVTNQPLADWKLDVVISGDHFLRVQTPVFKGVVSANARVRGTLLDPVTTGDAHVESGRITFPFGALDVDDAYAGLRGNDPRGPDLQIHASGRTLDYDVNLTVSGPMNGPNIEFSSTPPLSSEEILLLLTAGEVPQQQYTFSTAARAGRMATFLGKDLFSRLLGSDDTEDKLIINTGENISEQGKLTYSVEYLFNDRWSIIGEYDRFDAYNASLKWKIFIR